MLISGVRLFASASVALLCSAAAVQAQSLVNWKTQNAAAAQRAAATTLSDQQLEAIEKTAVPMEKINPAAANTASSPITLGGRARGPMPIVAMGRAGPPVKGALGELPPADLGKGGSSSGDGRNTMGNIVPQDYGVGNLNTVFHYNDYLNDTLSLAKGKVYPYNAVGKFIFQINTGQWAYCTATMISASLAVTAGHCVHAGSGGANGWNLQGHFFPGHYGCCYNFNGPTMTGTNPYKSAPVLDMWTYTCWTNSGALDTGCDIAIIVLASQNYKGGKAKLDLKKQLGLLTGWLGACLENCRQNDWFLTQVGYPGNYYSGDNQTISQHLEVCCGGGWGNDFRYGTGMRGGSSGGPHISNIGAILDSASSGQWPFRNIIFAVTSWGYINDTIKIQGSAPLANPANGNSFRPLWNAACGSAQSYYGPSTCSTL